MGICFWDTKLLHAFTSHLRKSDRALGLAPEVLAGVRATRPATCRLVPGHECAARIVAVGDGRGASPCRRARPGPDRLPPPAHGRLQCRLRVHLEGGLQEYVLLDERMILDPETGERFLIPVDEVPSGSAVALLEPWACVERSYAAPERRSPVAGGRLLVVDGGWRGRTAREAGRAAGGRAAPAVIVTR